MGLQKINKYLINLIRKVFSSNEQIIVQLYDALDSKITSETHKKTPLVM